MARPVRITKALTAASVNNVAQSQTPGAAGNLTLNGSAVTGGVAIFDTPRRVLITPAGNETGKTITVYGNQRTDGKGNDIQEVVAGTNAVAVATLQDFGRVTRIAVSAAFAGAVQVGTNTTGSTPWQQVNWNLPVQHLSVNVDVTGTVTYSLEYTYDDVSGSYDPVSGVWNNAALSTLQVLTDTLMSAKTADSETTFDEPISAWRITITAGTGSIAVTGIQSGIR